MRASFGPFAAGRKMWLVQSARVIIGLCVLSVSCLAGGQALATAATAAGTGPQLLFSAETTGCTNEDCRGLYVANSDGSSARKLVVGSVSYADLARDGRSLVFFPHRCLVPPESSRNKSMAVGLDSWPAAPTLDGQLGPVESSTSRRRSTLRVDLCGSRSRALIRQVDRPKRCARRPTEGWNSVRPHGLQTAHNSRGSRFTALPSATVAISRRIRSV